MRNLKKFLALVLAMLMVFSMAVITTSAADDADYSDAAHHLAALKILKGDENGNLNLDNGVTRWQAALFFVQALTGKTDAKIWNADKSVYFNDVPEYGTAIDYAYGMGLIVGRGNGVYGYADAITYQDMLVMAVRALGYEEDNMVYPSGYILAAQKLGLTENIAVDVNYKAPLTRGATAQIIWDMLGTEVAYVDPLSGNVVYPAETSSLELILNAGKDKAEWTTIERTTLLEESGFADAEFTGAVVEYIVADEDENEYEEDMVVVEVDDAFLTVKAADLGITAETKPSTYLGLPVTLYVDCAADEFEDKYADDEATIVFASYETYTVVENLGDKGNIKHVTGTTAAKSYLSLGGTKFAESKYTVVVKVWDDEEGWVDGSFDGNFEYEDGEYTGANSYGKVAYRVTDEKDDELVVVEALYTPYEFGQYNVLEVKKAEYATYTNGFATSMKLFGTNKTVTENTTSISNANGEYAKSLTVEGEEIESGDFMFYAYNKADNVLTVAKNCGTFETGRMTGFSTSKETVKVSGGTYGFGFDGAFAANGEVAFDAEDIAERVDALEKGKNNVKYLAVDGSIVWFGEPDADEEETAGAFDFVIATTAASVVADLLEMDVDDYTEALADGKVYVDENGYVAIAVLDTVTGEWKLASMKSLALTYDAEDEKYTNTVDVATYAEFAEVGQLAEGVQTKYDAAVEALNGRIFALISEKDGVYTLGASDAAAFATAPAADGIKFNTTGRTNILSIPGTDDDGEFETSRITMAADTVVVALFADGEIGVRVGATKNDSNNKFDVAGGANSVFYAVSNKLIVIDTEKTSTAAISLDLDVWSNSNIGGTTDYYVVLADYDIESDTNDDDETVYTVYNVYSIRNKKVVDITSTNEGFAELMPGDILYHRSTGDIDIGTAKNASFFDDGSQKSTLTAQGAIQGIYFGATTRSEPKTLKSDVKFVDGETMKITSKMAETNTITSLSGNANTFNYFGLYGANAGLDQEDYDFEAMVLATPIARYVDATAEEVVETADYAKYTKAGHELIELTEDEVAEFIAEPVEGQEYYFVAYALTTEMYESFNEPTEGVFNQFMIDNTGAKVLVPAVDSDDYTDAATAYVTTSMSSNISSTTVKLSVVNVITDTKDCLVAW